MTQNHGFRILRVSSPIADRMAFPERELERERLMAIQRRNAVIQNWLVHQSTEDLVSLVRANATSYGFVCAHSDSLKVQEAVLSAGASNTAETIWLLMNSEHKDIASGATKIWGYFLSDHPELFAEPLAHIFSPEQWGNAKLESQN